MKRIPSRLRKFGWNQRVLNLDDFYLFCEEEGVIVFDFPMRRQKGLYFKILFWHFIVLSSRLKGHERALVAWHEIGHYIWHVPGCYGRHSKTEREADWIAHVALIPNFLLNYSDGELWEMFAYDPALVRERVQLFQCFHKWER